MKCFTCVNWRKAACNQAVCGFFNCEASSQLNGLFSNAFLHNILEEKDYQCTDFVLPFIVLYVQRGRGIKELRLKDINTLYSELGRDLCSCRRMSRMNHGWIAVWEKVTITSSEGCEVILKSLLVCPVQFKALPSGPSSWRPGKVSPYVDSEGRPIQTHFNVVLKR